MGFFHNHASPADTAHRPVHELSCDTVLSRSTEARPIFISSPGMLSAEDLETRRLALNYLTALRNLAPSATTIADHNSQDIDKSPSRRDSELLDPHVVDEASSTLGSVDTLQFFGNVDRFYKNARDVEKQPPLSNGSIELPNEDRNPQKDADLVEWDGPEDPDNPQNWNSFYKWVYTALLGAVTFVVTYASSTFSAGLKSSAKDFHVSADIMVLGTSLFALGFAVGPVLWGPLSEVYGRKTPLMIAYFLFVIFQLPVGAATDLQTLLICRFFGGVFGSAPLAIVGGMLADMHGLLRRGVALAVFAGAVFIGPVVGPIVGSFVTASRLGWRWTEYITAIMGAVLGLISFLAVPETYGPIILQHRAQRLRLTSHNWAIHAKRDEELIDFHRLRDTYLLRPFRMLLQEPILALLTLYMGLVLGVIYLLFEAYPIAFSEVRGWTPTTAALPFTAIIIGVFIGILLTLVITKILIDPQIKRSGRVVPEDRLIPMIIGGVLFPAGLFWFGWTSDPNFDWKLQVSAGIPLGVSFLLIFLQGVTYIVDVYTVQANSALAANSVVRSLLMAGFPLFARALYHKLGVRWATSVLGFLALAMMPVPVLFYKYGKRIRAKSRFSPPTL